MKKLRQFFDNLRSSFWFMPSLMVMGSIALAVVLIEADSAGSDRWLSQWPRLFGVGAEGARQMLSTLAGSVMTVMGITFSMTLLALVLASDQYTSRILRNFMRSRVTQVMRGLSNIASSSTDRSTIPTITPLRRRNAACYSDHSEL